MGRSVAAVVGLCGALAACGSGHRAPPDRAQPHRATPAFDPRLHVAVFPKRGSWRTRSSRLYREGACSRQRMSWASTVPFADGPRALPPHAMIQALPPGGVILAVSQFYDRCRGLFTPRALHLPLRLSRGRAGDFPGPRGDELPLYRIAGHFAGRYDIDVWAFFGRRTPTAAQWAAAERELAGVRWPAGL